MELTMQILQARKLAAGLTLSAVILGVIGYFLRKTELNTIFDPVTGLASTKPITFILIALSVFATLVFFLFAIKLRGFTCPAGYEKAYRTNSPVVMVISFILALVMLFASYKYYIYAKTLESSIADSILALFAALSGLSYLTLSINAWRRKGGAEMPLCCFIFVIFICYWLILTYKINAADPVILDYAYDALALCASALAGYYITGFCYGRGSPVKTLIFSNLSVYLCFVAIAGSHILPVTVFYVFTAMVMLINSVTLIFNLKNTNTASDNSETDNGEPSFDTPEAEDINTLSESDSDSDGHFDINNE